MFNEKKKLYHFCFATYLNMSFTHNFLCLSHTFVKLFHELENDTEYSYFITRNRRYDSLR